MSNDSTEQIRRDMINSGQPQADLAATTERTWTTDEATAEFSFIGFCAPFVVVVRRADGVKGSLEFTHSPRKYFNWQPDR